MFKFLGKFAHSPLYEPVLKVEALEAKKIRKLLAVMVCMKEGSLYDAIEEAFRSRTAVAAVDEVKDTADRRVSCGGETRLSVHFEHVEVRSAPIPVVSL